jgi:hypothetical protein
MTSEVRQNKESDAAELLRRLFDELALSEGKQIKLLRLKIFDRILPIFQSCFERHKILTQAEQLSTLKLAVIEHKRRDKLCNFTKFMEILKAVEQEILKVSPTQFYISTKVTFAKERVARRWVFQVNDVSIVISSTFSENLELAPFYFGGFGEIDPNEFHDIACLVAGTTAKSRQQAADAIFRALDVFLGLTNFLIIRGRVIVRTGKIVPKSEIVLGPYQLMHLDDGTRFKDEIWYQPVRQEYRPSTFLIKDIEAFLKGLKLQLKKIVGSIFSDILKKALSRYYSATMKIDRHDMLIEFWGILELLTASERMSAEVTIKRATSLSKDPWLRQRSLERASEARNRYIHVGTQDDAIEDVVDELKNYVEQMIDFLMRNEFKLASFLEFIRFLDLPSDSSVLSDQIKIRRLKREMLAATRVEKVTEA